MQPFCGEFMRFTSVSFFVIVGSNCSLSSSGLIRRSAESHTGDLGPFTLVNRRAITFLLLWPILIGLILKNAPSNAAESRIAPQAMVILKANCFGCHNEEKKKGGLLLTSRAGFWKGNEDGPVIQIGKADQSKLIQALATDADPHMPPKKQLTEKQISVLRGWIDDGAAWDEKALTTFGRETPLETLGSLPFDYEPVLALAMSPDGNWLAAGRGGVIALYDMASTNLTPKFEFREHRDAVESLAWDPTGHRLASGAYREILIWNLESRKRELRLTDSIIGRVTALKFSSDGSVLAAADGLPTKSGLLGIWNTATWTPKTNWQAHSDSIMALDISHDGKLLATAGADKLVKLWTISDQTETAKLEGHTGHVLGLGFNSDDSMLASASADKVLNLWDTKTREQKITLPKHPAPLTALAWSGDGKRLASASEDGMVRIYTDFKSHSGKEQSEGAQMRPLPGIDEVLYSVAFSRDGKTVYAGAYDGLVYFWNVEGKLKGKLAPARTAQRLAAVKATK